MAGRGGGGQKPPFAGVPHAAAGRRDATTGSVVNYPPRPRTRAAGSSSHGEEIVGRATRIRDRPSPRTDRVRPRPYAPQVAGSAIALLYLLGGVTALLVIVLPHPETLNTTVRLIVGIMAPLLAVVVWSLRHRMPAPAHQWLLGLGSGIITLLVAQSGSLSALVSTSFFYTWVVLYAVLFLSPVSAGLQVGGAAVAYGLVLVSSGSGGMERITAMEPISLISVIGTTALIVTILSRAREMSQIDPLTRVANRRGLEELLTSAMNGAARDRRPLVVAMVDIDHFKSINDRDGHGAGDAVLQHLSSAWSKVLRPDDALARFGGDEFVVILPDCTRDDAEAILQQMRTSTGPKVTCSVGAATWQPGDSASLLLGSADAALYQAKRQGRNRVAWAEGPPGSTD